MLLAFGRAKGVEAERELSRAFTRTTSRPSSLHVLSASSAGQLKVFSESEWMGPMEQLESVLS